MGRSGHGVRAIKLAEGDEVVGVCICRENATILTVTENGKGRQMCIRDRSEPATSAMRLIRFSRTVFWPRYRPRPCSALSSNRELHLSLIHILKVIRRHTAGRKPGSQPLFAHQQNTVGHACLLYTSGQWPARCECNCTKQLLGATTWAGERSEPERAVQFSTFML